MKKTFSATVSNGKLLMNDKDEMLKFATKKEGIVFFTVNWIKKIRSSNQNKYYWGVIISLISKETGTDPEDVHKVLTSKYLHKEIEINGESVFIIGSTTDLSTIEFEKYMEECRRWASSFLSIIIPDPENCAKHSDFSEYSYKK